MADPLEHFPNDSKPIDVDRRSFHRIKSPSFDVGVDPTTDHRPVRRPPSGLARDSGARGPDAFKESGFLGKVLKLFSTFFKGLLLGIPLIGQILLAIDAITKKLTGTSPIDELFAALGRLAGSTVEGGLFSRFMRAIPSWVPVGRVGYTAKFIYTEDAASRTVNTEDEREIEGFLTASYQISNDVPHTQWTKYRRWAFHVMPHPGHQYLIGNGNIVDQNEEKFINEGDNKGLGTARFQRVLRIYGQDPEGTVRGAGDRGAIECMLDVGAISKPVGDGGGDGVLFASQWPYWPMTGDYFWAAGRWAYDCQRAVAAGKTELFPSQMNPCKAFATSRIEGHKFVENANTAEAVKFFFFASSEGGYVDFRGSTDRNKVKHPPVNPLRSRDYEFVVDLPPHDEGKSPFAIGSTIEFARNTLVLRPRLLMQIRFAPFALGGLQPAFADGLKALTLDPKIEILRPADPNKRPQQAKITIPLTQLPAQSDPEAKEMYGFELAMGWHDPAGDEIKKLVRMTIEVREPIFYSQSGPVRFAIGINGRWTCLRLTASRDPKDPPALAPNADGRKVVHNLQLFLPKGAPVTVVANGIWVHGFGEFLEGNTLDKRRLFVGGVLLDVSDDDKKRFKAVLDDIRKTVNDLRKTGQDVKDPKKKLKDELRKKIDEQKKAGGNAAALDKLQQQLDALVDDLPDTPDGFKQALAAFDSRLVDVLGALDAVEDFLKITDDLVGERFFPDWLADIDAEVKTGLEESKRVSSIARSLFARPTPVINRNDAPLGWVEFVDDARVPIGRNFIGNQVVPSPRDRASVDGLLKHKKANNENPIKIRMVADQMTTVGSGSNLAKQIAPIDGLFGTTNRTDYEFELRIRVDEFPFPTLPG
ncbi:MAG: hypothetical protein ABI647_24220 [Gemmatimonadota bacterium]